MRTTCGLRSVVAILDVFNEVFDGMLGEPPSYNTIEDWIKKIGLDVNQNGMNQCKGKKYAGVIDESILIGNEKLLLMLGIPSQHMGRALQHGDACVLKMSVSSSWKAEDVKKEIDQVTENVGNEPDYLLSDKGTNLVKAVSATGICHHLDISHAFGAFLKQTYSEKGDYKEFTGIIGKVRLSYHLTNKAFLLPPKQRSICRFMNMFNWVEWAQKMLRCYQTLSPELQQAFAFVPENRALIEELSVVMDCIKHIQTRCKNEGLTKRIANECRKHVVVTIMQGNNRMIMLGLKIIQYLMREATLISNNKEVHNISDDIIESIFGLYKSKKSPNHLCGVTPFVLLIPLYTQLANKEVAAKFDFKQHLMNKKISDVDDWATENLSINWVTERTKTFKNVS